MSQDWSIVKNLPRDEEIPCKKNWLHFKHGTISVGFLPDSKINSVTWYSNHLNGSYSYIVYLDDYKVINVYKSILRWWQVESDDPEYENIQNFVYERLKEAIRTHESRRKKKKLYK